MFQNSKHKYIKQQKYNHNTDTKFVNNSQSYKFLVLDVAFLQKIVYNNSAGSNTLYTRVVSN